MPDAGLIRHADAASTDGATPVHLAVDGRHVATFALADPERPESAAAIAALRDMGLRTQMLSGDLPATAQAMGARLGIDRAQGLTPTTSWRQSARWGRAASSWATASTMRRRWPPPTRASPSAPGPTSPSRPPMRC
ncbi:HAD family hydrolase [Paracoccus marcusii]|uniref:HAD family hydrolase n=1 Tax=Paracoccus marcusii TaxID=59779 RepID=UPI002ED0571E|nr:HAD family hydrolase [Paracoccus marcusii]